MEEIISKKIWAIALLILLGILTFFILKPILLSIVSGLILAFIFTPIHNKLTDKFKSRNLSAWLICIFLIIIIITPIIFLAPVAVNQSFKLYVAAQQFNFVEPLNSILPSWVSSETFSNEIQPIFQDFISKSIQKLMTFFSDIIINFPKLLLHFAVVLFTFFFALRDNKEFVLYVKTLMPFPENIKRKLFSSSKGIAVSVLYGQVIIGVIQGAIVGISFFLFGIPNPLLLFFLSCVLGVLPIIGVPVVWIPVTLYLLMAGNTFAAVGVAVFGMIASTIDNFIRPFIVSKRTEIPSSIILIGMIGGLFMFGILGLILGPLILAYLLVMLELYRFKKTEKYIFVNQNKN